MRKFMLLIITVSIFIVVAILYDYIFLNVEFVIEDIYIDKPTLTMGTYDVLEEYSDDIQTEDDVKAVYITISIHNRSFLKEYRDLSLRFEDENNLYPFVSKTIDMGWESGIIKKLKPREKRICTRITAIVDKNLSDSQIKELIASKKVALKGAISLFDVNLTKIERVSNFVELK